MQALSLRKIYQKHPEYNDSRIDWVGKMPKNWEIASMRRLFSTNKIRLKESANQYKILSLTLQGVIPRVMDGSGKNPADYSTYQGFKKDDLVFCQFDYDVTPRTIGYVDEDGMMTGAYTRLIPKHEAFSKYYYYYFLSLDYTKELLHLCTGLRNSLSKPLFWSLKNPLPSLGEQEKIAKYLDEKTSFIDQIIEKKKKLIELLKEKRTAVINQAVTKGLDPKANLVDSGIDWIGQIPKEWGLEKLKNFFKFKKGSKAALFTKEYIGNPENNGQFPVYSGQTENQGVMGYVNSYEYSFKSSVIFTTTVGAKAMTPMILTGQFNLSQNCLVMVPKYTETNANYYFYQLIILFKRMKESIPSYMQPSLRASDLNKYFVMRPSSVEQNKIVDFLDISTVLFDQSIRKIEKSIILLQEFKSSLISNVVTGKVKI